ncbi:MAG: 5'/3'-nucleotidase SurE [Rhodobacterales bacterium]|nr:5'/3'-nucleotidase SurE [Rhodobacterales bacterium]
MLTKPLSQCRVLLSNDDGVHAPGIKVLQEALAPLVAEIWVVAPESEQSAASHSLTLRHPLRVRHLGDRRYAVSGTPTDSVLLGVNQIMRGKRPDLVISGVNRGGNLGEDVIYSGTVAAAMEGTLLDLPAIAFSQVCDERTRTPWDTSAHWIPKVMDILAGVAWPPGVVMNVNFPDVPADAVTGVEACRQGKRKIGGELVEREDPRGEPYYWFGVQRGEDPSRADTDLEATTRGAISLTPLTVDLTHDPVLAALKAALA